MNDPNRIVIIADDLSGACDTGAQFASILGPCNLIVEGCVASTPADTPGSPNQISVIDTESRNVEREEAARRTRSAVDQYVNADRETLLFKKIDSTLRGHIGAEVGAMLEAYPNRIAVVAPSFPEMGRTVESGICLVDGTPLQTTEYSGDQSDGRSSSAVADSFDGSVIQLFEPAALDGKLEAIFAESNIESGRVIIMDAKTTEDLDTIAESVAPYMDRCVYVGSAGLAGSTAKDFAASVGSRNLGSSSTGTNEQRNGPILGFVGSTNARSRTQLEFLIAARSVHRVDIDAGTEKRAADEVSTLIDHGSSVVVCGPSPVTDRKTAIGVIAAIEEGARLIKSLVDVGSLGGFFATGGETAYRVVRGFGVTGITIEGEVSPGVPRLSVEIDSNRLPFVTKAGGFGGDSALCDVAAFLGDKP